MCKTQADAEHYGRENCHQNHGAAKLCEVFTVCLDYFVYQTIIPLCEPQSYACYTELTQSISLYVTGSESYLSLSFRST